MAVCLTWVTNRTYPAEVCENKTEDQERLAVDFLPLLYSGTVPPDSEKAKTETLNLPHFPFGFKACSLR